MASRCRLSRTTTRLAGTRRSTRCVPMKPAPPMTRIVFPLSIPVRELSPGRASGANSVASVRPIEGGLESPLPAIVLPDLVAHGEPIVPVALEEVAEVRDRRHERVRGDDGLLVAFVADDADPVR